MCERLDSGINTRKLEFLYRSCSMPSRCLDAWLRVPAFADGILQLLAKGIRIGNKEVYEVAKPILEQQELLRKNKVPTSFEFQTCRRGINHISRELAWNLNDGAE